MKTTKIIAAAISALLLSACINDFLDEPPRKQSSTEIETFEQLNGLFITREYSSQNPVFLLGTDLAGVSPVFYSDPMMSIFISFREMLQYVWDCDYVGDMANYAEAWEVCYGTWIFPANTILEYIDKVTGDAEEKANLVAEAHYYRAFANMELMDTYCLPYCAENLDEPGLPRKTSTSFEQDVTRISLRDTHKMIEDDILEALKIERTDMSRSWHVSLPAAQALAARFYLYSNDYEKALEYAEKALAAKADLVDYNSGEIYLQPMTTAYGEVDITNLYNDWYDDQKMFAWKEFYHFATISSMVLPVSDFLLGKYDQENDLRYDFLIVDKFGWLLGKEDTSTKGFLYFGMTNIPFGPTVQEMILTKAECQARLGEWQEAMETLVPLRNARMRPGTPKLTATSQNDAILKIADERIRELTFATRWSDIRRYNNNETDIDDVTLSRTFYPYTATEFTLDGELKTYTLDKKSRRFAAPLPTNEILLSQGQIVQNTY